MKLHFWQFSQFKSWFLSIFEISKNGIWSKKLFVKLIYLISRVFWPGLYHFFKFSGPLIELLKMCKNFKICICYLVQALIILGSVSAFFPNCTFSDFRTLCFTFCYNKEALETAIDENEMKKSLFSSFCHFQSLTLFTRLWPNNWFHSSFEIESSVSFIYLRNSNLFVHSALKSEENRFNCKM